MYIWKVIFVAIFLPKQISMESCNQVCQCCNQIQLDLQLLRVFNSSFAENQIIQLFLQSIVLFDCFDAPNTGIFIAMSAADDGYGLYGWTRRHFVVWIGSKCVGRQR